MIGSTPISAVLGGAPAADAETPLLKSFAKAATAAGLALLLIAPGSKEPVDMRSPKKRRDDDEAAQAAARERGRTDWMKARSLAGAHLATTDGTQVCRYIDKYRKVYGDDVAVNFAIEVGRSNLVVVDTDTTEQTTAFLTRAGAPADLPPTVRSPGSRDHATGEWAHYGGGHFYFTVPEGVELPTGAGSLTVADGEYAILWRDRYLLIPPSERPEGLYRQIGREYPVPQWIVDLITERAQRRVRAAASADENDPLGLGAAEMGEKIDAWAETVSWADLLAPLGWSMTSRPDGRCGCPVWTAPGAHHSPKSATTHDTGCELDRYTTVNAPMHVWTDNPGEPFESWIGSRGTKTLTKLQVLAIAAYDGDVGKASEAIDVLPGGGGIAFEMGVDTAAIGNQDTAAANLDQSLELPAPTEPAPVDLMCNSCGCAVNLDHCWQSIKGDVWHQDDRPFPHITGSQWPSNMIPRMTRIEPPEVSPGYDGAPHVDPNTASPTAEFTPEQAEVVEAAGASQPGDVVVEPEQAERTMTLHRPQHETPEGTTRHCPTCDSNDWPERFEFDAGGNFVHNPETGEAHSAVLMTAPHEHTWVEHNSHGQWFECTRCGATYTPEAAAQDELAAAEALPYSVPLSPEAEALATHQADTNPLAFDAPVPAPKPTPESTEFPATDTPPADPVDDMMLVSESNGVPKIAPFGYWREYPAPEYAIDGLIEQHALSCVIGPPGVGKSTFIIDIACSLVTGIRWHGRKTRRQRVLYLPGEGLAGAAERIRAWEKAHELNVHPDLLMGDAIIQLGASRDDWTEVLQYVIRHRVGMIIFDTFARMSLGIEENSATDVGKAITRFDQIRKLTGAGVMVIHHTGKTSESARGSSALNGALDSELLIRPAHWDTSEVTEGEPIEMITSKQKNAARLRDPMPLVLTPMHDSVVVTGPSGIVGDPIDAMSTAPLHISEPVIELAVRLRDYLDRFPEAGLTRGDLVTGVEIDPYTDGLRDPRTAWKHRVYEAVDLGLRLGLIETTTGKPSGARFVPGPIGREAARRAVASEAMNVGDD